MDDQSISALEKNNLLKNVNITKLNLGNSLGKLKSVNGGEVLYREGDSADRVYMVINGEINLLKKKKDGKSESVVFTENDFFGAKELFTNIERCSTTVSLMDTYLIELSKEELESLIQQDERIGINIQKGNNDFKYDDEIAEVIPPEIFEYIKDEKSDIMIHDNISDEEINKIIESLEEGNDVFLEDMEALNIQEDLFDSLNSKENIENDEKNSYNWITNENEISEENFMSEEQNQVESNYMTSEQFEMIVKSLALVNANVKRDDVLKNIVDVAINITNADRGTLYLVEKESNEIWSKVLIGNELEEIRLKIGEGIAGWVAESGETLNINDVNEDERFDKSFDEATGYTTKTMLVYPIKNKTDDVVGVLQLLNSLKGGFSKQEESFLNAISINIALALENASLVEQLVSSERDRSIGKIGHFLAHDIKKPILTCKRYAEHLKKKELSFDVKQVVNLLDEQLDQVTSQLSSASGFTEGTTLLRKVPVSLNDTIYDFGLKIQNLVKTNNCKIEHELTDDVEINIDRKEFYQCYYNIIKNACEALPEGGNILVSTEKNGDRINLSFNDKGVGIDSANIDKVFDPLFSKNKKNNSGLGLAISKKIVEDHEGNINITSDEEMGTTVTISLPIH